MVAALALLASAARGAEGEDEAQIIAAEDAAEAALPMDKLPRMERVGLVALSTDELPADPTPLQNVGTFTSANVVYVLRVANPKLLDKLRRYDRKQATLLGKIRMRGKYFVVVDVPEKNPGTPRTDRASRM
jgi:hypothetical protein